MHQPPGTSSRLPTSAPAPVPRATSALPTNSRRASSPPAGGSSTTVRPTRWGGRVRRRHRRRTYAVRRGRIGAVAPGPAPGLRRFGHRRGRPGRDPTRSGTERTRGHGPARTQVLLVAGPDTTDGGPAHEVVGTAVPFSAGDALQAALRRTSRRDRDRARARARPDRRHRDADRCRPRDPSWRSSRAPACTRRPTPVSPARARRCHHRRVRLLRLSARRRVGPGADRRSPAPARQRGRLARAAPA